MSPTLEVCIKTANFIIIVIILKMIDRVIVFAVSVFHVNSLVVDSTFVSFMEFIEFCLFGSVETLDPEVKIISLAILSPGRPDIVLMVPENGNPKGMWFTLKEGSKYCLKFTFHVNNNIVSGLRYTNTVWKTGVKGNKQQLTSGVLDSF